MTNRARGFTLVEVVIALSVGALVTLVAHTTVNRTLDLADRSQSRLAVAQHTAGVRRQLADWLGGALVSLSDQSEIVFIGEDAAQDTTRSDRLHFTSVGVQSGARTEILVFVDDDPRTPEQGLVATLRSDPASTRVMELARAVTDVEIRYLFQINRELRWFSGWSSSVELPLAVEIHLSGKDLPRLLELPITVLTGGRS